MEVSSQIMRGISTLKNKWVVNQSNHVFTAEEKSGFEKGFKFTQTTRRIPKFDVVACIEPVLRDHIDQTVAEVARDVLSLPDCTNGTSGNVLRLYPWPSQWMDLHLPLATQHRRSASAAGRHCTNKISSSASGSQCPWVR